MCFSCINLLIKKKLLNYFNGFVNKIFKSSKNSYILLNKKLNKTNKMLCINHCTLKYKLFKSLILIRFVTKKHMFSKF